MAEILPPSVASIQADVEDLKKAHASQIEKSNTMRKHVRDLVRTITESHTFVVELKKSHAAELHALRTELHFLKESHNAELASLHTKLHTLEESHGAELGFLRAKVRALEGNQVAGLAVHHTPTADTIVTDDTAGVTDAGIVVHTEIMHSHQSSRGG